MAKEAPASLLGSASWLGAGEYDVGDEYHERATSFATGIKWEVLASRASNLRNGTSCSFHDNFSIGNFNMVRRIVFEDGASWVARLRMPEMKSVFGEREKLDTARILKVEIASMEFMGSKTSIPVPKVHGYSVDPANDVGALYILMDYIHGTVAAELRQARDCDIDVFGTAEQDRKFKQQMAEIQVELSTFTFDLIGSLYQNEETLEFFVGPEIETGKGPWRSSTDYYADLADHELEVCAADAEAEVQQHPSFTNPILFKHLISLYGSGNGKGPFRLTNRDFGAHNLLVKDDFTIIGVIDFDRVMAAPDEVAAQYPSFAGLEREPPGHIESRPLAIERIKAMEPKIEEYKNLIEAAEAKFGGSRDTTVNIADLMTSDAASIYQGLREYGSHQNFLNEAWMGAYSRLLHKHVVSRHVPTSLA